MENPASVQAMLVDICVENCGHFLLSRKFLSISSGQIFDSNCGFDSLFERNLTERRHLKTFLLFFYVDILLGL